MRYANRIDANQNAIVDALREAGASVRVISQGDGIPDLLVGYKNFTILMEVKDGDKVPSARAGCFMVAFDPLIGFVAP